MNDVTHNDLAAPPSYGINWITIDEHGHVQIDAEALKAYLGDGARDYIIRRDDLLEALPRFPESIDDEEWNKKATDYVGLMAKCIKAVEAEREARKAPFLSATRLIDGFFQSITGPLGTAKGRDTPNQLRYIIETRQTKYQLAKAERERKEREEAARLEREAAEKARLEAEAAERAIQTEADLKSAIERDQQAKQLEANAHQADKVAAAPLAELSRTRSDLGATSSLTRFWDFRDLNRAALDLEKLREHLPLAALEQAVRSFISAGGRELGGCYIFENARTRNRA